MRTQPFTSPSHARAADQAGGLSQTRKSRFADLRRFSALLALLAGTALFSAGCGEDKTSSGDVTQVPDDTVDTNGGVTDDTTGSKSDVGPDSIGTDECTKNEDCTGIAVDANKCEAAICNAQKKCVKGSAADGATCDDGKECTPTDTCKAGACSGEVVCVEAGTDPICRPGSCGDDGKCTFSTANGKACDDGNDCTDNDKCIAGGKCVGGTIVTCDDGDVCTQDLCDKDNGGCKYTKLPVDTACEDGDKCTTEGKCDATGKCVSTPVVCGSTGKPCQIDFCDQLKGCTTKASPNNEACSDGNSCTENDICSSGACVGKSVAGVDDGNPCTEDVCDGKGAQPSIAHNTAPKDGSSCEDGQTCTKGDSCLGGTCVGTKLVCNDQNACTEDVCDASKCGSDGKNCGQCVYNPLGDGALCSDGKSCTGNDKCAAGKCTGVDLLTSGGCDDNNVCTTDGCLEGTGCINTPTPSGTTKFCNDGNACTELDKCAGTSCSGTTRDCNDNLPCTADTCDAAATDPSKACKHEAYSGPCDDKDACTDKDTCLNSICAGTKLNCDDGNPCTSDFCDTVKGCQHQAAVGGSPCDDGLSCTTGDYCDAGECKVKNDTCTSCTTDTNCLAQDDGNYCNGLVKCIDAGEKGKVCAIDTTTIVTCDTSSDTPCATTSCDPDSGACIEHDKQEGVPCTSPDKCVANAACNAQGECLGEAANCDDNESCTTDACDPATGCTHVALADNAACSDGNDCTPNFGDRCKTGKCTNPDNTCGCSADADCKIQEAKDGNLCNDKFICEIKSGNAGFCVVKTNSATVCPASTDPCQTSSCEMGTGQCVESPRQIGSNCDDGNVCTLQTKCDSSYECKGGTAMSCEDNQPCTIDVCDKVLGCFNSPAVPNQVCDDGSQCTKNDKCVSGVCTGIAIQCDDNNPCTLDICNKTTGCSYIVDNTLLCNDGDPCTTPDKCDDSGLCIGMPLECDDNNPCTVDLCDNAGGCKNTQVDGKDCDDGNNCSIQDTCLLGVCSGKPLNCDDNNPCTNDTCQNGLCTVTAAVGQACTDNNECTEKDKCTAQGTCEGSTLDCSSKTVCQTSLGCLPTKGCQITQNDGVTCNDNDSCTGTGPGGTGDKCQGGACTGPARDCNDNNICTTDTCDPKKSDGCVITANTCDDDNECTIDTCDQTLGCQHEAVSGALCDDGDACTEAGKCAAGVCVSKPISCDDNSPCTEDSCDVVLGCQYVAVPDDTPGLVCDDNDPCTDTSCVAGVCEPTPKSCDDDNPCTVDACDQVNGCTHTDAAENTACDDGDECTQQTKCLGGSCSGGVIDGNGCGICASDTDCKMFDNNDLCDGKYSCKASKTGLKLCYFDAAPVVCDSTLDSTCNKNLCDPLVGTCAMTESLNGTKCQDGLGCTSNDFCLSGACKAGPTTDCSGTTDSCNTAQCVEDVASPNGFRCEKVAKIGAVPCDADGNGCTGNDHCSAGTCVKGDAVDCSGVAKTCESATCKSTSASSFQCEVKALADGASCEDGQLCTTGDNCQAGQCKAGNGAFDCSNVTNTCAIGTCDPAGNGGLGACMPTPRNEGQTCNADGNACTVGDKCVAGACVPGAPPDCTSLSGACTVGACKSLDASAFQCVGAPKADNLPCEADSNGCTVGDSCKAGKCEPGKIMDCSAKTSGDGCLIGTCVSLSAAQGDCQPLPAPQGKSCNSDSNGCTQGDTCNGDGACLPGTAVDCLAFTGACTQGVCQSTGSQTFTCVGDKAPDGTVCDADGSGCTQGDKCTNGKCTAGTAVACDGTGATTCLQPKCMGTGSTTYYCELAPVSEATPCDADSNGCTKNDSCVLGFCASGAIQSCDSQSSSCATSACQSTGTNAFQCKVTPLESYGPLNPAVPCDPSASSSVCPSGYSCVGTDTVGECAPTTMLSCDDGTLCTQGDYCNAGACVGGTQKDCDDQNPCTADSCTNGNCVNTAIAGCQLCVEETVETYDSTALAVSLRPVGNAPTFMNFTTSITTPLESQKSLYVNWSGSNPVPTSIGADTPYAGLRLRRVYADSTQALRLQFLMRAVYTSGGCGSEDIEVWVNGAMIYQKCDETKAAKYLTGTTHELIDIDLSAYTGAAMDIEIRVVGTTVAGTTGSVWIDRVRLAGACEKACLAGSFEPIDQDPELTTVERIDVSMPQSWVRTTSSSSVVNWNSIAGAGAHTGTGRMQANWTANATAVSQTATLTIPSIQAASGGSKLYFAVRAPELGNAACGSDDLVVRVNNAEVYKLCASQANWGVQAVSLPAGQTVTVTFEAVVGAAAGSKGTVEIDDIGVTGACAFDCFSAKFDGTEGMSKFTTSSSQAAAFKPWVASTTTFKTAGYSAFAGYSASPAVTDSKVSQAISERMLRLGLEGGVVTFWHNVFMASPSLCTGDVSYPFLVRGLVNLPATEATGFATDGNYDLFRFCGNTSGWQPVSFALPDALRARDFGLGFAAVKVSGNAELKSYVDDVIVMCR